MAKSTNSLRLVERVVIHRLIIKTFFLLFHGNKVHTSKKKELHRLQNILLDGRSSFMLHLKIRTLLSEYQFVMTSRTTQLNSFFLVLESV
jgi:hypothetical protein